MQYVRLVREFNTAFNCGAPPRPGLPAAPTDQQRMVRVQLIGEETSELSMAMAKRCLIGCLDSLCDLEYVVDGGFVIYGADCAGMDIPGWMSNAEGPPRIPPSMDACLMHIASLTKQGGNVAQEMISGDWRSVATELLALRGALASGWSAFRVPDPMRLALFEEVHRSNMSKLVDGKPVLTAAGRVFKPETYSPPDLEGVLNKFGWKISESGDSCVPLLEVVQ